MTRLAADEEFNLKIRPECSQAVQEYANNFEAHAMELGLMIAYSGRDLNDMGRYDSCNDLNFTRYISFGVRGLPIGIYLGI